MKDQVTQNPNASEDALLRNSNAVEDVSYLLDKNVGEVSLAASCGTQGAPVISLVASCGIDETNIRRTICPAREED